MKQDIDRKSISDIGSGQANAYRIIAGVKQSWQNSRLLATGLLATAIALPLVMFLYVAFAPAMLWLILVIFSVYALIFLIFGRSVINEHDAARLLNEQHPELEESAALVLKPQEQLGFLETLQVRKVSRSLAAIHERDSKLRNANPGAANMRKAAACSAIGLLLAVAIYFTGPYLRSNTTKQPLLSGKDLNDKTENILPAITRFKVTIAPPAYTGVANRSQQRMNIRAEEGSNLIWEINTKGNPSSVQLVFNDSSVVNLESLNKQPGSWAAQKRLKTNGFYQLSIDHVLSEFYQLETIPDKEPSIVVQTPRPSTVIEYGQSPVLPLNLVLADDYGISDASIIATIASGNGEAVKFKEQKLSFNQFVKGARQQKLSKIFTLPSLGMQPGDELYFYITAVDNNRQETKSDIFTVKLEDTATLLSMDGMMSGIDLKPEFFRSQRQIIIETEQLLKGRDTMSKESFNNRCNDLGIDQKLLRLRYGKFLGEESETNIGEEGNTGHANEGAKQTEGDEHDDDHDDKVSVEDFNNAEKIIDRYAHKHDIAEDATFFDPQTKKDLKAVLAEMWDSELRLRTYKPTEALPYEYKALRLLKELQQKSREYVAKTNTKTTPLKPEKRLTGELDKIINQENNQSYQSLPAKETVLRKALALVDELKASMNAASINAASMNAAKTKGASRSASFAQISDGAKEIFEQTAGELSMKASADPRLYLPAFEAIKRILKDEGSISDLATTGKALQRIVKPSGRLPANKQSLPGIKLSKEYFDNLNKSSRGT